MLEVFHLNNTTADKLRSFIDNDILTIPDIVVSTSLVKPAIAPTHHRPTPLKNSDGRLSF
jgi:hypothetical protein